MFFESWVRDDLLEHNPFDGVKSSSAIDESRNHYVPAETVKLAIDYCPDAEWRAIFALARFGGLRPGEIYALKPDAIKWERRTTTGFDNNELCNSQSFHCVKTRATVDDSTHSPDDRQAHAAIHAAWPLR